MATKDTTKKTSTTKTSKDDIVKDAELEALRSENASLNSRLDEMQNQLSQFMAMMQMMNRPASPEEIKDIEVISLAVGQLVLTTTGRSDGIHYEFTEQFKKLMVPEPDLKQIIKAMPRTTENGLFFINDNEFVRKNGLTFTYRNLMTEDMFRDFFSKPHKEAMEIYNNANDAQKEIIQTMAVSKILDGDDVDANILRDLGKVTGKNFMDIIPLEELKEG